MKTIFCSLFALVASLVAAAQERPIHEVHSAMLYNFIKYIQWPDQAEAGKFVIGVIGDEQLFATLKNWYEAKPKGAKQFEIRQLQSSGDAADCHVVYIGKSKSKEFENIRSSINGKSVLTVTNQDGLAKKGSCINFKMVEGKLRFELNAAAAEAANLKVSTQLSAMAIVI